MNLTELMAACDEYSAITADDEGYHTLLDCTDLAPDLTRSDHRQAVVDWLRNWHCLRYAREYDDRTCEVLRTWYAGQVERLPRPEQDLGKLDEMQLYRISKALGSLASTVAAERGGSTVTFGRVAAAKTLFAIRPRSCIPWDNPIMSEFRYAGTDTDYLLFLRKTKGIILDLERQCEARGYRLADLPAIVQQPSATVPKLVDEFLWVTITHRDRMT